MVYLINLPFKNQDDRVIQSLGLAYMAADLQANGIEVFIFDGCGVDRFSDIEVLFAELIYLQPTHIGFYVVEHNFDITIDLISKIKKSMDVQVFLGGPQVAFLADEIMNQYADIDFILVGESEGKLPRIINQRFTPNGVLYRENGIVHRTNPTCDNLELDKLVVPLRKAGGKILLTQEKNNDKDYYCVPISSSRGCPYMCTFCAVPAMVARQRVLWRFRSAYSVCCEIREIYQEYQDIYVRFIDDNFLVDIGRAMEICREIRKIGDIPFSFSGRVNSILSLTDDQLLEMKQCGLTSIEIGVENFNENVLIRYKKHNTVVQIKNSLKKLIRNGINPMIDFIMFDPWTTLDELQINHNAIVELGLDSYDPPFLINRLYPFPGTFFYSENLIDMNHYFHNTEIEKIYSTMIKYMRRHKEYRDYLCDSKPKGYVFQAFLRLPYKVFAYLIENPDARLEDIEMIKSFEKACYYKKGDYRINPQ